MTDPKPRIPEPPTKEELDQVSREQAMIADEWAPDPGAAPQAEPGGQPHPPVQDAARTFSPGAR